VGQGDDGGPPIRSELAERVFGPLRAQRCATIGKTLHRGECASRIDDGHVEPGERRHGHERLRHVHGTDYQQPRRRMTHVQEPVPVRARNQRALVSRCCLARGTLHEGVEMRAPSLFPPAWGVGRVLTRQAVRVCGTVLDQCAVLEGVGYGVGAILQARCHDHGAPPKTGFAQLVE
jgi:hypothetical protein